MNVRKCIQEVLWHRQDIDHSKISNLSRLYWIDWAKIPKYQSSRNFRFCAIKIKTLEVREIQSQEERKNRKYVLKNCDLNYMKSMELFGSVEKYWLTKNWVGIVCLCQCESKQKGPATLVFAVTCGLYCWPYRWPWDGVTVATPAKMISSISCLFRNR